MTMRLYLFSEYNSDEQLYRYGYIDGDGNVIVPPRYSDAYGFSEGLAAVCEELDGPFGFIDTNGEWAIPPMFDAVIDCGFTEGLCAVVEKDSGWNGKWGYIDLTGQFVIPAKYFLAGPFKNGVAPVQYIDDDDIYAEPLMAEDGSSVVGYVRSIDDDDPDMVNCWGFIDKVGDIVVPTEYEDRLFQNGDLLHLERDNEVYYFDRSGKRIWPPLPDSVKDLCEVFDSDCAIK